MHGYSADPPYLKPLLPDGHSRILSGGDKGVDILAKVYEHNVPYEFSEETKEYVKNKIPKSLRVSSKMKSERLDLRDELIVTIDGKDAKDFDDAISVSINEDGTYRLGVHIADVTHYVKKKSALDLDAIERGTSVYLTDRVVPMLPFELSMEFVL